MVSRTFEAISKTVQLTILQYMMTAIFSGVMTNHTQGLPEDYQEHFLHCIDYMRQSIMCSADLAMEAHDEMDSDDLGPMDGGWSGLHGKLKALPMIISEAYNLLVCKDYSQVISYLDGEFVMSFFGKVNANIVEQIVDGVRVILPIDD